MTESELIELRNNISITEIEKCKTNPTYFYFYYFTINGNTPTITTREVERVSAIFKRLQEL